VTQYRPPDIEVDYDALPANAAERHEAFVDILGQYVLWLRNWSVASSREIVESPSETQRLGKTRRERYEGVAAMSSVERESACRFAEATVDRFIQMFLALLAGTGVSLRLGRSHAIRFKLEMEIVEVETEDVVDVEAVNRGGRKSFMDYWGRWLNRYGKSGS